MGTVSLMLGLYTMHILALLKSVITRVIKRVINGLLKGLLKSVIKKILVFYKLTNTFSESNMSHNFEKSSSKITSKY